MLLDRLFDYLNEVEIAVRSLTDCHIEKYDEGEILSTNRVNLHIRIRFSKGHLLELNEAVVVFLTTKHLPNQVIYIAFN